MVFFAPFFFLILFESTVVVNLLEDIQVSISILFASYHMYVGHFLLHMYLLS